VKICHFTFFFKVSSNTVKGTSFWKISPKNHHISRKKVMK
jgi:hypothetical protein